VPKLLDIASRKQPFAIKNKSDTKAEITLYGAIGGGFFEDTISAKQFSDELKKLPDTVKEISLRINSPGGDVFDGMTIYNRLKQHKAKVTVYVDGIAASIASIIAMAGDEIIMGEGTQIMVHLPWTFAYGNARDFEETINRLDDITEQMISIYAKKTKKSRAEIKSMLTDETWLDSETAISEGFADKVVGESLGVAASLIDKKWLHKTPKNIKIQDEMVRSEVTNLKNKVEAFLARK